MYLINFEYSNTLHKLFWEIKRKFWKVSNRLVKSFHTFSWVGNKKGWFIYFLYVNFTVPIDFTRMCAFFMSVYTIFSQNNASIFNLNIFSGGIVNLVGTFDFWLLRGQYTVWKLSVHPLRFRKLLYLLFSGKDKYLWLFIAILQLKKLYTNSICLMCVHI